MAFRSLTLIILSLFLIVSVSGEAHAKKSFFDAMFGWLKPKDNSPDPAQTLEAPFAYDGKKTGADPELVEQKSTNDVIPLKHAHTSHDNIGKWLITAVSETMSYNVEDKENIYEKNKAFFAESGLGQFRRFMIDNNIEKVVESGRFNIRSFVKEEPLLLNSQSVDNRYRWLFEVPMMVSYMDAENFDYKNDEPVNQHLVLTIQVGRDADAKNEFGVVIETWAGKSQKIDKN